MSYRDIQPSGRTVIFNAICLPLDSPEPGRPRLLSSCSSLITRSFQEQPREQRRSIPLAHAFAYVDIGAGIPDLGPSSGGAGHDDAARASTARGSHG